VIWTFEFRHLDAQALLHSKVPCFPRDLIVRDREAQK